MDTPPIFPFSFWVSLVEQLAAVLSQPHIVSGGFRLPFGSYIVLFVSVLSIKVIATDGLYKVLQDVIPTLFINYRRYDFVLFTETTTAATVSMKASGATSDYI